MGQGALSCEIGKLLNGPGKPRKAEPAVIQGAFRCGGIPALGEEYMALAPKAVNNNVLLPEAPGEPRLCSWAGDCAPSEKPLPFQLPEPHGQRMHPTASQLRGPPV